jgi:hypothetical protein
MSSANSAVRGAAALEEARFDSWRGRGWAGPAGGRRPSLFVDDVRVLRAIVETVFLFMGVVAVLERPVGSTLLETCVVWVAAAVATDDGELFSAAL